MVAPLPNCNSPKEAIQGHTSIAVLYLSFLAARVIVSGQQLPLTAVQNFLSVFLIVFLSSSLSCIR
jgi:hypothetical protein